MKNKNLIITLFLGGFVMPPCFWLLGLWYYHITNLNELLQIVFNPFLWIYVVAYSTMIYFILNNMLKKIEQYISSRDENLLEEAQKNISLIPKFFIVAEIAYCIIGPNIGMLGRKFLTMQKYLFGEMVAIPIIILFAVPFLTCLTTVLEHQSGPVLLSKKHRCISISMKLVINMIVPFVGITALIIMYNYMHITFLYESGQKFNMQLLLKKNLILGFLSALVTIVNFTTLIVQCGLPIKKISEQLFLMSSGNGDLSKDLDVITRDDIGKLSENFNSFIAELRGIIMNLKSISSSSHNIGTNLATNSEELSSALEEIAATINSYNEKIVLLNKEINDSNSAALDIKQKINVVSDKIENQTSSVNESCAAVEEMIASVNNVSDIARQKNEHIKHLLQVGKKGQKNMQQTIDSIGKITKSADIMLDMINVVNEIAEKTNLLSMNASIEAAHAGDRGKGFSVVANEIRKLAESSRSNSKNITRSLQEVLEMIKGTDSLTRDTGESINIILGDIESVSTGMNEVVQAMNEMAHGSEQILTATSNLMNITVEVKESSSVMNKNAKSIEDSMHSLTLLSKENTEGIFQISTGVNQITESIVLVSELGVDNSKNIDSLNSEIKKFILSESDVKLVK